MNDESKKDSGPSLEEQIAKRPARTYWDIVRREFFKNKIAVLGGLIVIFLFAMAIYAPFLANDKPFSIRTRFVKNYEQSWKGVNYQIADVERYGKSSPGKAILVHRKKVSQLAEQYRKLRENQVTAEQVMTLIEQDDKFAVIKSYIQLRKMESFGYKPEDKAKIEKGLKDPKQAKELIGVLKKIEADTLAKWAKKKKKTGKKRQPFVDKFARNILFKVIGEEDKIATIKAIARESRSQFMDIGEDDADTIKESFDDEDDGDEFVSYLKYLDCKLDEINLAQVIGLLKKHAKLSKKERLAKIKNEILFKRVSPFNISFEKEDEIKAAGGDQGFLNYLANFKSEVQKYIKQGASAKPFSIKDYIASLKLDEQEENFIAGVEVIRENLPEKFHKVLEGLEKKYSSLLAPIKKAEVPDLSKVGEIRTAILAVQPAWLSKTGKISKKDLRYETRYPAFAQLSPGEVFFMVIFLFTFFAWIPFRFVDKLKMDSFDKFLVKIGLYFLIPFLCALVWYMVVPQKNDSNNYREVIANFGPGDYAWVQPIFYGPDSQDFGAKYTSPSWSSDNTPGFFPLMDEEKIGTVFRQDCVYKGEGEDIQVSCDYITRLKKNKEFSNYAMEVRTTLPVRVGGKQIVVLRAGNYDLDRRVEISPGGILIIDSKAVVKKIESSVGFHWLSSNSNNLPNYRVFGTDSLGRDIFTRMIWGARISLSVGFVAVGIYVFIGIVLGALAGYFAGWVDIIISRFIEVMICFPALILIITVLTVFPKEIISIWNGMFAIMVVLGITRWTGIARLIRGEFLRLRNQDFVIAGTALGVSNFRLIFRHILPNAMGPVLVAATFGVAAAILIESSLSFLGLGVQPPTPTWGDMLAQARGAPISQWWLTVFPGFAIFITVTAYNLVGEGIRDALDPRLKER